MKFNHREHGDHRERIKMRNTKLAAWRSASLAVAFALMSFIYPQWAVATSNDRSQRRESEADKGRIRTAFEKMPLHFVENRGQLDGRVAYYGQARDASLYFTSQGVTLALTERSAVRRYALKLDFLDANPNVKLKAQDPMQTAF